MQEYDHVENNTYGEIGLRTAQDNQRNEVVPVTHNDAQN